jgi:hypothetical protein
LKSSPRFEAPRPQAEERPETVRSAVGRQQAVELSPVVAHLSVAAHRAGDAAVAPEAAAQAHRLT